MTWRLPDWEREVGNRVSKAYVAEAGGWVYEFRNSEVATHLFVPAVQVWADMIAASIAASKDAPVAIFADTEAATHARQPAPNRKGT